MKTLYFDQFRINPENWKLGIFYFCPADSRIIVPRRAKAWGWTLNLARPLAIPIFLLMVTLLCTPIESVFLPAWELPVFFLKLAVIGVMVWHCGRFPRASS